MPCMPLELLNVMKKAKIRNGYNQRQHLTHNKWNVIYGLIFANNGYGANIMLVFHLS